MKSIEHAQRQEAMDHDEAVRMRAAEKYVLGELSPVLREEYEEHFFACVACALEVKAAAAFVDNACDVLRQRPEVG
jgi:anti-sigma factor RsiW